MDSSLHFTGDLYIGQNYPGEKDHADTRLAQVLVGTKRISMDIHEIFIIQHPVMPKRAGTS